jgi:heptosyltransferase-1
MRVLIIKMSSLGDIIHTLPALTDAKKAMPDIRFDWVVEESFSEIPLWHPAVQNIIPIALRRFRKQGWHRVDRKELSQLLRKLRAEKYDLIIDAQGLLKSAALTWLALGKKRAGFSWKSARESIASLFYQEKAIVPWGQHAVHRTRALFAKTLGYSLATENVDYGIEITRLPDFSLDTPYYVFLHGTTWDTKHWPEVYWIKLAKIVTDAGFAVQLLWGNDIEKTRAEKIAAGLDKAFVMQRKLTLAEAAGVLAQAKGVVTVDTGLGHLAAALSVPSVGLFGPTNPNHSGMLGQRQVHLASQFSCAPCHKRACTYQGVKLVEPPCFTDLSPQLVWERLNS